MAREERDESPAAAEPPSPAQPHQPQLRSSRQRHCLKRTHEGRQVGGLGRVIAGEALHLNREREVEEREGERGVSEG